MAITMTHHFKYTYDDFAETFIRSLLKTFPVDRAAVYFFDADRREFHLRGQRGMTSHLLNEFGTKRSILSLPESDEMISHLKNRKGILKRSAISSSAALNTLERIEADLVAPFWMDELLAGFCMLGRPTNGTILDMDAVEAFACMGEEMIRYIFSLERELTNTSDYSHDMNNDTKSLVQTLQYLQSSLSAKQPREKILLLLKQAEDVATRLNQTFELNSDRSQLIMKSIRGEYDRTPVDIAKLARLSCARFISTTEKKNISLKTNIPDRPILVEGNAADLSRMIDNMINYAMRYSNPGGQIEIEGRERADQFELEFQNNGDGMEPHVIERIWEQGWQVTDARQGASGLGLSIARQIVHLHDGNIGVEKSNSGGTIFKIQIPLMNQGKEKI